MPGLFDTIKRAIAAPFTELGVGSTAVYGGQISRNERNPALAGTNRWRTAEDLLVNFSIVAAGTRFFLNMAARPSWSVEPAEADKDHQYAEFAETLLHGTDTSWTRTVRRGAAFKFHGFGFHEWTAKKRDDGKIGFGSIEPRAPQTIIRWDMDDHNSVLGVTQRNPQSGGEIYLPREKLIYFVDDALTDSPEGMGWFRHLVEPRDRMKKYLNLEKIGFERDLAGTPIGRAPYAAIEQAKSAAAGDAVKIAQLEAAAKGIEDFVMNKSKQPDTGLMLDSMPYIGKAGDGGQNISTALQWGVELLTGSASNIDKLGAAISRTTWDMALIMGTERLLVGQQGSGSLALSQDTSVNLALNINSVTGDMAEVYDRDMIGPAWALNGLPPEMRPTLKVGDSSFQDVEKIARTLSEMAQAGAVLAPDDPAIDDIRDLAGISRQPEMTEDRMALLMAAGGGGMNPHDNPNTDPNADPNADPNNPKQKPKPAKPKGETK